MERMRVKVNQACGKLSGSLSTNFLVLQGEHITQAGFEV